MAQEYRTLRVAPGDEGVLSLVIDVIALPDKAGRFLVRAVRLGQGGFILTVEPADGSAPWAERQVTLTTAGRVRKFGRARVL